MAGLFPERDPRSQINEKLIKIKQEQDDANYSISSFDSSDMSHVYEDFSRTPRPQRFYQDLDHDLNDLTRDQYINELITHCSGDYDSINDYRFRLAERARGFPECPESRLVNRRTTTNSTKVEKCASDCYILNMFNNGDRSKEIYDVFSTVGNNTMNESIFRQQKTNSRHNDGIEDPNNNNNNNAFIHPETTATLLQLRSEIKAVSDKQNTQNELLTSIRTDMKEMTANVRLIYGATKSMLSKMPEMSEQSKVDKLQNDVLKISSSLGIISKKLNDKEIKKSSQAQITTEADKSESQTENIAINQPEVTKMTYAETVMRPSTSNNTVINSSTQETVTPMQVLPSSTPLSKLLSTEDRTKTLKRTIGNDTINKKSDKGKAPVSNKDNVPVHKSTDKVHFEKLKQSFQQNQNHMLKPAYKSRISHAKSSNDQAVNNMTTDDQVYSQDGPGGFTAVKHKKIVSYHISNIDIDVNIRAIYEYLREKHVKCTNVRVYYGKEMASARVNIHESDSEIVEDVSFWPEDIVCRKWQSKADWESELEKRYREKQQRRTYRQRRNQHRDHYDFGEDTQYYNDYYDNDKNEQAEIEQSNKWWNSYGTTDHNRNTNEDNRDYQSERW